MVRKRKDIVHSQKARSITKMHNDKMKEFKKREDHINNLPKTHTGIAELKRVLQDDTSDYILKTFDVVQRYINIEENDVQENIILKNKLIEEYMYSVNPSLCVSENIIDIDGIMCSKCQVALDDDNGFSICTECGISVNNVYQSGELSYKEMQELDYKTYFAYDKMTHFEEWLRRFEAKENKMIPQEVLDQIVSEAQKARITDLSKLSEGDVRTFLKKLGLNEYYDNKIAIINRINNRPSFVIIPRVKEKLKDMFRKIQEPYAKYKDPDRRNMFSYPYLLNKFFLILGLPEFSVHFTLLRSADKLRKQDKTFFKIVEELSVTDPTTKWRFFPSF